jgi:hypothetical protein
MSEKNQKALASKEMGNFSTTWETISLKRCLFNSSSNDSNCERRQKENKIASQVPYDCVTLTVFISLGPYFIKNSNYEKAELSFIYSLWLLVG